LSFFALVISISNILSDACFAGNVQRDLRIAVSSQLEAELSEEVRVLADSTLKGREFGRGGASGAAFYIARQLEDAGYDVEFQCFESNGRTGHNVVAVTPGKYSSYIVVGAYFDGYGTVADKLYPGADSNLSGVVSLLALARHFKLRQPISGGRGLIFVAFDGHCSDLAGSRAFVEKNRSRTVSLMVNLDTVGSSLSPVLDERPDYLMALGGASFSESMSLANVSTGLHLTYDYYGNRNFTDLFYLHAGDQCPFLERRIPSVMFTSGISVHTNKTTDTPDTLDYKVLVKRLRFVSAWISSMLK